MARLAAVAVLSLALAGPASAQCLTPADLDNGIRVTFANSDWTEIRRIGADIYDVHEFYAGAGSGSRYSAAFGVVPTEAIDGYRADAPEAGTPYRRAFDVEIGTVVDYGHPGEKWQGAFVETTGTPPDSSDLDGALSISVAEGSRITMSGCDYAATLVEVHFDWASPPDNGLTTWSFYLTDLGVAVLFAAQSNGRPLVSSPPVSIVALDGL